MEKEDRMGEITRYMAADVAARQAAGGEIHMHFHQAPVNTAPVDQRPGQTMIDRYFPYLLAIIMLMIVVGGLCAMAVVLMGMIVSMLASLAICAGSAAVLAVAVGGSVKGIMNSQHDKALTRAAVRNRGR